ncbi:MAG: 50S ribosomal protein L18 [Candidatus Aenigmarchaeota archaeon]|nr:50S ribosomal protein L18 [Candidatus Aenigmarchaeota archaeon]
MLRRRREGRTDYRARLAMVKSRTARIVIRKSLNNIHIQVIDYSTTGDKTVINVFSKKLAKYDWKYHGGSMPSAYLIGFLAGNMALSKGIKTAYLDIGLQTSTKGSVLYAAALGAKDSGLNVPIGKDILPSQDRISGKHIAKYAEALKKSDQAKYNRQFSYYNKNNLEAEKMPEKFAETKSKINGEYSGKERDLL